MAVSLTESAESEPAQQLAALDLGSNSFHLIVAQHSEGRLQMVDKIREMVRLAAGLDEDNCLRQEAIDRAVQCLERIGQRLRNLPRESVRVVGTNTLRKARNSGEFLAQAEIALGHNIEIISGREEARLVYLGVSYALEDNHDKRLVIDIGGGSTELILGQQFEPRLMESLYMGCVGVSQEFFADGRIKPSRMKAAELAARQELEPIRRLYLSSGWDTVIGSSGTILTIHDVVQEQGWSKDGITATALAQLRDALVEARNVDNLNLPGLSSERRPVFPGGVAILSAIFTSLDVDRLQVSQGALREGLLHDLVGRVHLIDARERGIEDLARRYHVDVAHASRIIETAETFFQATAKAWNLGEPGDRALLRWAAMLHEVGMEIAHSQYHKHGDYLLQNSDLPGFSRAEQQHLALLVRTHRRKFPLNEFARASGKDVKRLIHLAVLLRLAVLLHRSRADQPLPAIELQARDDGAEITVDKHWLDNHTLTRLDLAQEARYLKVIPFRLSITESEVTSS
jgi:exopolyphosphatase/guanosine-5'-triphosphate,3'-diphosphate pyrophosphatase